MEAIPGPNSFPFLRLPVELQYQILGYLLPNEKTIGIDYGRHFTCAEEGPYYDWTVKYRAGNDTCYPSILSVNRQISEHGQHIVYNRVFLIKVTDTGYSFLKYHRDFDAEDLIFPFDKAKQIQVDIHFCSDPARLYELLFYIMEVKDLLSGYSLKSLQINIFDDEDTHISPISSSGLSYATALVDSDLELMLLPFKDLKNVGMCEISLLPPPRRAWAWASARFEQDHRAVGPGISHQTIMQDEDSSAAESVESRIMDLLNECKDAMTNPDYDDDEDNRDLLEILLAIVLIV